MEGPLIAYEELTDDAIISNVHYHKEKNWKATVKKLRTYSPDSVMSNRGSIQKMYCTIWASCHSCSSDGARFAWRNCGSGVSAFGYHLPLNEIIYECKRVSKYLHLGICYLRAMQVLDLLQFFSPKTAQNRLFFQSWQSKVDPIFCFVLMHIVTFTQTFMKWIVINLRSYQGKLLVIQTKITISFSPKTSQNRLFFQSQRSKVAPIIYFVLMHAYIHRHPWSEL